MTDLYKQISEIWMHRLLQVGSIRGTEFLLTQQNIKITLKTIIDYYKKIRIPTGIDSHDELLLQQSNKLLIFMSIYTNYI